jgi:hypothetical protein
MDGNLFWLSFDDVHLAGFRIVSTAETLAARQRLQGMNGKRQRWGEEAREIDDLRDR